MKQTIKKYLSIFLSVLIIITYVPTYVYAQEQFIPELPEGVEVLRQQLSAISSEINTELSLWNNRGYTSSQLDKLEDIMDKYIEIISDVNKIHPNIAENLNYSFDIKYFQEYKNQVRSIRLALNGNAVTTLSNTQEITVIKKTLHNKTLNMERALSGISFEVKKTLPNASAQAAKAELKELRRLIAKILEKPINNNLKFKEQLLAHILDEDLNIDTMIARLQRVLEISQNEVSKKAIKIYSISDMIETLKLFNNPKGQAQFIEVMEDGMTLDQKLTIHELCKKVQDNKLRYKLLNDYVPEVAKTRAAQSAADIARIAGVSMVVITAVLVLATVVTINADEGNSFEYSMNPGTLKHRVKNGTADIIDMVAFYQLPTSREYIKEHIEEFSAVVLLAVEAATTPHFDKIMNEQFIINDQNPKKVSVNDVFDKAIDEALNKSIDLEIPQA